ncbi:hypothetical protein PPACK8108_LOCUS17560 [Phakopsora pachyrhizi]|uniref:Uncharacterized protein n=1 Tax=Phakopsora pachyrhizi TaxID=170000 RepID=A0AAV0BDL3_PHAPC|nr:hypothetical protein PPACK8108_LOCUS17560 [Phakopsora pachyrhizi]
MPSSISRAFHPSRYNLNKIIRIALELREAYIEDQADDEFFGEIIRQTNHVQKPSQEDDCGSDCSLGDWPRGGVSSLLKALLIQKEFEVLGGKLQPTIGSTAEQELSTMRSELLATSNNTGNSGGGGCLDVEEERGRMKIEILKRFEQQQRVDSKALKKSDGDGYYYFDDQNIGEDCQTKDKDKKHKTTFRDMTGFPIVNDGKDTPFKSFRDIEESSSNRDKDKEEPGKA